jgi:hypothetical protein
MSPPQADGRPLPPDEARPQATNGSRLKQKRPRRISRRDILTGF